VAALWLAALVAACGPSDKQRLEAALVGRGRIACVAEDGCRELHPIGSELTNAASLPPLAAALAGGDGPALVQALVETGVQGLLLDLESAGTTSGLARELARYAHIEGLQGAFFSRGAALYVLDPVRAWSPKLRAGLALVARRLIGGTKQPKVSSFPAVVRKLEPAEVMVLLRTGDEPRLWRSARGSSFARALLTASAVARQRWVERANALGGPIDELLPGLTVDLALLQDDGEIGQRSDSFVDRVVLPVHGVGYERKGGWHYLLPEATHKQGRAPSQAYRQLFKDDGLPVDSLDHSDLRLYRMAVQILGTSEPQREPSDGLSDVQDPDEVLDHEARAPR
jgi:hypothetical protein